MVVGLNVLIFFYKRRETSKWTYFG